MWGRLTLWKIYVYREIETVRLNIQKKKGIRTFFLMPVGLITQPVILFFKYFVIRIQKFKCRSRDINL